MDLSQKVKSTTWIQRTGTDPDLDLRELYERASVWIQEKLKVFTKIRKIRRTAPKSFKTVCDVKHCIFNPKFFNFFKHTIHFYLRNSLKPKSKSVFGSGLDETVPQDWNREGTIYSYLESLRLLVLCTGGGEEEGEYAAHRHHARHVVRGLVSLAWTGWEGQDEHTNKRFGKGRTLTVPLGC